MKIDKNTVRLSLRISKQSSDEIDRLRQARVGSVSRNTWIAEAIEEKLERDLNLKNMRKD